MVFRYTPNANIGRPVDQQALDIRTQNQQNKQFDRSAQLFSQFADKVQGHQQTGARKDLISQFGANPDMYALMQDEQAAGQLARDPAMFKQLQGMIPDTAKMSMQQEAMFKFGLDQEKQRIKFEQDQQKSRRGEKRGEINAVYKDIDKGISTVNKTYGIVKNLSKEVLGGNRAAVAGLMVNLVKLGDPNSAVLAAEMAAAMNIKGWEAAAMTGDFKAMKQLFDELDPDKVDIGQIMQVADSYRRANASSISENYNRALEQRGVLPEEGQRMTYSDIRQKSIDSLNASLNRNIPAWFDVFDLSEANIDANMKKHGIDREQAISDMKTHYMKRKAK